MYSALFGGVMVDKKEALSLLAQKRKSGCWGNYLPIASFHDGIYECDHVSPYTKSAGNLDADVFLMLQDWSSEDALNGPICRDSIEYGHTLTKFTNVNLKCLLERHFELPMHQAYGTNLFPFIKRGPMNGKIPRKDMVRAAIEYALPQIEIVGPRIVICFGLATFNALRSAVGTLYPDKEITRVSSVAKGIESPFAIGNTSVWLQAHTGRLGQNNRNKGGVNRVEEDWSRMVNDYSRRSPGHA